MGGARGWHKLRRDRLCDELRQRVRAIVARPAFARDFDLRDQLSGAAESPCPNIAEGFSRFYPRDNGRFVRTAKASLTEVIVHIGSALANGFVEKTEHDEICSLARRARKMATNYARYLETAEVPGAKQPKGRRPRKP